ncbi:MAG: anti-sigma factor family protein [Desulfomonilaceae bacterium]
MKDQVLDNHVDDLRLPYLEGLLSPEEKANFEDHLDQCPACKSRLKEMSRWTSILRENAREMCPESWELFDYVRTGKDLRGTISSHVETCHLCGTDVESFRKEISEKAVPDALWKKMQTLSGTTVADRPYGTASQWVLEKLGSLVELFRPMVLVPVAVAVTVLLVVLLYPTGPAPMTVALSSVKWGPGPSASNLMGRESHDSLPSEAKKEQLGVVILFSNVKHPPDRNLTDSLYRAIEPPKDVRDRYNVVSPDEISQVAGKDLLNTRDEESLVKVMRSKLKISRAFVIEIVPSGNRYGIVARLINADTGIPTEKWDSSNLTDAELPAALERAGEALLRHRR